jgi:hypothetical protein
MMSSRLMLPVRGRDVAAGALVWWGLVLIAAGEPSALPPGRGSLWGSLVGMVAGLALIVVGLSYVMPYSRPWPIAQWRAWRGRRAMAFGLRRPLALLIPSLTRSAFGLLVGEWLGARVAERLAPGAALPAALPTIGGLFVLAVLAITVLLDG